MKKGDKKSGKYLCAGRRFGKTGLVYHSIIETLPISEAEKKKLHEEYERALRGEE